MTLVIELKDELEEKVEQVARQRGTTVSDLVAGYLESVVREVGLTPKSRVDELLELIGDVQTLPNQDDKKEYYEAMARKHA